MFAAIPDEKLDFQPHEKSWALLALAAPFANPPRWIGLTLATDELDLAAGFDQPDPMNMADMVAIFDGAVAEGRTALEGATADAMTADGTLRTGDEAHFQMPKGSSQRCCASPFRGEELVLPSASSSSLTGPAVK